MFFYTNIKSKNRNRQSRGFTLIELLIVIGIIGVLSSVALASLNSSRRKADDSKRNQDMAQVKTALELYAQKNNYVYPSLAISEGTKGYIQNSTYTSRVSIFNTIAKPVFAEVQHVEPACQNFDRLAEILVTNNFLPAVPHDPQDAESGTCYKAYSIDTDNDPATIEAIAGYALLWEKYTTQTGEQFGNKKTGFIVSKTQEIDGTLAAAVCTTTGEYPILDLANTTSLCTRNSEGKIADRIIGVTDGEEFSSASLTSDTQSDNASSTSSDLNSDTSSDTASETQSDIPSDMASEIPSDTASEAPSDSPSDIVAAYCSNPAYTDQANCTMDRSYCSNPVYADQTSCTNNGYSTSAYCSNPSYTDEWSCISNGSYANGSCSDPAYTDQSSCTNNGSYVGGSCSGGSFTNQASCESAGYYSGGYCNGNGSYTDQASCEGSGYTVSGYCSNSGFSNQSDCVNAGYTSGTSYCSDSSYSNQGDCVSNGSTWNDAIWVSYNYTWYPDTWISNNYTWNPGQWSSYNYIWYPGTYTSNTWYPGTFTANTWSSGTYTPYVWNSVPGATWNP